MYSMVDLMLDALVFTSKTDLCSIPSNVRTADSSNRGTLAMVPGYLRIDEYHARRKSQLPIESTTTRAGQNETDPDRTIGLNQRSQVEIKPESSGSTSIDPENKLKMPKKNKKKQKQQQTTRQQKNKKK